MLGNAGRVMGWMGRGGDGIDEQGGADGLWREGDVLVDMAGKSWARVGRTRRRPHPPFRR